ncbi:unnamed protein product [Ceutorhynchus assimilis]|uniref:Uncharacterized protein n=1 Tax=Ceutorhynchus assimilis TaxID=467358 RepID=A0A9N9MEK6_9CUCU|nr:unnamed protein product [Ceutorhynchus assimilis]
MNFNLPIEINPAISSAKQPSISKYDNNEKPSQCGSIQPTSSKISNTMNSIDNNLVNTIENSTLSEESEFKEYLKFWAVRHGVTHSCLNELIVLIKPKYNFLSNDARTLLGTPRNKADCIKLNNGDMIYFGIKSNIISIMTNEYFDDLNNELYLYINVDGIPIYNSSAVEFWPILHIAKISIIVQFPLLPFIVALATRKAVKKKQKFNKKKDFSDSDFPCESPVKKRIKTDQNIVYFSDSSDYGEKIAERQKPTQKEQSGPSKSCAPSLKAITPQNKTLPQRDHDKFESQKTRLRGSETHSSLVRSSPSSSIFNADPTLNYQNQNQFQQSILEDLTTIRVVQEQQSTLLAQIWQTLQVQKVQALQRPPDVPDLPIDRKRDFGN